MTLDDKIAEVRALIAQRDDVDRQIAELLGDAALTVPAGRKPRSAPAAKEPKAKGHKCSICGKRGHNVTSCPNGKGTHPNNPPKGQGKTERIVALRASGMSVQAIAEEMGMSSTSTVSYHLAKNAGASLKPWGKKGRPKKRPQDVSAEPARQLTEEEFDRLKEIQKGDGFSSRVFASTHDLPLPEVNKAVTSLTYDGYLNF